MRPVSSLHHKLLQEYGTEDAYREAIQLSRVEIPEQIPMPASPAPSDMLHASWWPCGCPLPWWSFRRGLFHMYVRVRKDENGRWHDDHVAYETCPTQKRKRLEHAQRDKVQRRSRSDRRL